MESPQKELCTKALSFRGCPAKGASTFCCNGTFAALFCFHHRARAAKPTQLASHLCLRGPLLTASPLPSVNLVRKLTGQWDP